MLNDDCTTFTDNDNNRKYSSYKAYKINSIKLLLYNNSDKKKLDLLNNMELKEKTYDTESLDDYSVQNKELSDSFLVSYIYSIGWSAAL